MVIANGHTLSNRLGQKGILTIATFPVDSILPLTGDYAPPRIFDANGEKFYVQMDSSRYACFQKSRHCLCCDMEGTIMALQRFPHDGKDTAHFNLYGIYPSGECVLLTKDHIKAKSKGGPNSQDNYQTLCIRCNTTKKNHDLTIDELQEIAAPRKKPSRPKMPRVKDPVSA